MTTVLDARQPRQQPDGSIRCEVLFSDALDENGQPQWLPFTCSAYSWQPFALSLYQDLLSGRYGAVAPFSVTQAMIGQARDDKRRQINHWRDAEENGRFIFHFMGRRWDAGKEAMERLTLSLSSDLPPGFFWTDADDNDIPVNETRLQQMLAAMQAAMLAQGFKIHERQRQMKKDIDALTDYEAITRYQPGWPDAPQPQDDAPPAAVSSKPDRSQQI